ncbi:hypothetical protein F751_3889 [Auxenochlorella protothecoides]|uniref:Uncharacterized protein n=1 Tax=Auxenochlorella protothecoides TaxID=3075 RepID=A0A087SD69_AUXPR|nr:hypothetical protein F751_3889 [Auxenochlorella protothecoides]KFM23673.1 hypothetical protein F751_3889 [Auxenochlorella protothecoides]
MHICCKRNVFYRSGGWGEGGARIPRAFSIARARDGERSTPRANSDRAGQGAEDTLKHRTFDLSSQRCFTSEAKWHDSRPKCPVLGGTAAGCTTALSASDNPRPGTM